MKTPAFGSVPCTACKGTGYTPWGACSCDEGWIPPGREIQPLPRPKPKPDPVPVSAPNGAQRPNLAPTGPLAREPKDTNPQTDADRCRAVHPNIDIVAHHLQDTGRIDGIEAVYELDCPWCGFTRRNTRLAATIHTLRHDYGWDIETVDEPGRLATYILR